MPIFRDEQDYSHFLQLLERLLTPGTKKDRWRNQIHSLSDAVSVIAFALMPNHFHLIVHQRANAHAVSKLMQRLCASYTKYFNRKYKRHGPLFEGRFHHRPLNTAQDIRNAIVYVHRNPVDPLRAGSFTSHELFIAKRELRESHWCRADLGLKLFRSRAHYLEHLHDAIMNRDRAQGVNAVAPPHRRH
jgi:REP element-mobilizing transposase RayT